jgi:hypothetical integral membrane protein (TIGR02206 family)
VSDAAATFSPFTPLHFACVAVCAFGWWMLVRRARSLVGTGDESTFRRRLAGTSIAFNAGWTLYRLTPAYFDIDASLPLHACDFAWMFGAAALLRRAPGPRLDREFAYFFGIGLAPIGIVTPVLTDGPSDIDFWAFWLRHFLIPACALVDLCAFGFVPTWRGLRRVIAWTVVALVPITMLNVALDVSYFFTGSAVPDNPTPLDALGPWPERLLAIAALGIGWFALLCWAVRSRLEPRVPSKA